jgi:cytochrome c553
MQRISVLFATAALMLLAILNTAHAAGDPAAGREKSQTCAACHGEKGNTQNSMYPKLAGQHPSYLYNALKGYKSGTRENAVMNGQVSNLSEQDLRDLAAYYGGLEGGLHTLPLNNSGQ